MNCGEEKLKMMRGLRRLIDSSLVVGSGVGVFLFLMIFVMDY